MTRFKKAGAAHVMGLGGSARKTGLGGSAPGAARLPRDICKKMKGAL